jgi:large repetitive protein
MGAMYLPPIRSSRRSIKNPNLAAATRSRRLLCDAVIETFERRVLMSGSTLASALALAVDGQTTAAGLHIFPADGVPTITSSNSHTFTTGVTGTFDVTATGSPTPSLAESPALPTGLTFITDDVNGTATLSGTPGAGTGGTYRLSITASNGVGSAATQTFVLTIDQPPAITSAGSVSFTTGNASSFTVSTTGFPGAMLQKSGTLPGGITFNPSSVFEGTQLFAVGGNVPEFLTLADFNNDGKPDIATSDSSSNGISILLNESAPSVALFSTATFIPVGNNPGAIASADFNHDGDQDLVVADYGSQNVDVLMGNGDGTFHAPQPYSLGFNPTAVITTDINGDGIPDIVAAGYNVHEIAVMLGNGNGTFQAPIFTTLAGNISRGNNSIAAGDFNGDGNADLAVATGDGTVSVLDGNGNGTFQPPVSLSLANSGGEVFSVAVGDLNNDGHPDIVAVDERNGEVDIFLNNGDGTFAPAISYASPSAISATLADINGDGNEDIVLTGGGANFKIIFGNGDGTFQVAKSYTDVYAGQIAIADINGDGKPDVVSVAYYQRNLAVQLNAIGTATISGTPQAGTGGTYPITITAGNHILPNASQSFTLTVDQAPVFTTANNVTFFPGTAGSFNIITTGFPTATLSDSGGTLPEGVSFVDNGNGTATLSGTPEDGTDGLYNLTLVASNGITTQQQFTLEVGEAPAFTSGDGTTDVVGTYGYYQVTVSGFPTPSITELGTLPAGLTFTDNNNGTAALFGTPQAGSGGIYDLTLTGANNFSTVTQSFALTIDEAPQITSGNSFTFAAGLDSTFTISASGFPTPTLNEDGGLPDGVTFVDNGDGTATLSGTPAADSVGNYDLTLTAMNSVSSDQQLFTLTVAQSGTAPNFISSENTTFTTGIPGSFSVVVDGSPTPSLSEIGTLPPGISFIDNGNGTGTLSGTPAVGAGGIYDVTFDATNIVSPTQQSFTLTVGQSPTITSANNTTFTAGTAGSFTISATGFPTDALSESGALPAGLTFLDNGNGTARLFGTPAVGTGGTYALTLAAANTSGTAPQTFTLTVDQAPAVTSSNSFSFAVDQPGDFSISTTGFPAPSLNETGILPSGVTFHDNGNGTASIFGTPAATGSFPLTITAANSVSSSPQSFTLIVNVAGSPPQITSGDNATFTVGTAGSFPVTANGSPTPTLTELGGLPAGVSFVDNGNGTATLSGTPAAGTGGTYTLSLTALNSNSQATQTFILTVDQGPAFTSVNNETFTVGTLSSFTVITNGVPAGTLMESGALPVGLTFLDNGNGTATLSGTPAAGAGGDYNLVLTASNSVSSSQQPFTLVVDQAPAITSGDTATFIAGSTSSFAVTASGFPVDSFSVSSGLPTGISLVDNGNGTASLAGVPAVSVSGTFTFTITASNGVTPDASQTFTLSVPPAPTAAVNSTGTLDIVGSTVSNTATIEVVGSDIVVTIDTQQFSFPTSSVNTVDITLGDGNDSVTVGVGVPATSISAGGGNDSILATNAAADSVGGGPGNDTINVTGDGSSLSGGMGNDSIIAGGTGSTVGGGQNNDTLVSTSGDDVLNGGAGDDFFFDAGTTGDSINGGVGLNFSQNNPSDSMQDIFQLIDPPRGPAPSVAAADSVLSPAQSSDVTAVVSNGVLQITGTTDADTIAVTTNVNDTKIKATADGQSLGAFLITDLTGIVIAGKAGADTISVDASVSLPTTLKGGGGNDSLSGGGGDNVLVGGAGADTLVGGGGTNVLIADQLFTYGTATGEDSLIGGSGFNIADFSYRTDNLDLSNSGAAVGSEIISSTVQAIWGGTGNDSIVGTTPGDFLSGGVGADTLQGGSAGDTNDLLVGGKGKDSIVVAAEPVTVYVKDGAANDTVSGYTGAAGDILESDSGDQILS